MIDLQTIRARLAAASPRPWRNGTDASHFDMPEVTDDKTFAYYVPDAKDAAFIAHAPDDIAALLAEVEQMQQHALRGALTEDEVTAALHAGHAERRVAEGDNAWTSLVNERSRLRGLLERACKAIDTLGDAQKLERHAVSARLLAAELRHEGGIK